MKKFLLPLALALTATTLTAFGQAPKADAKTEAQLIALEKAGWEAWKKQDVAWVKANTADDFVGLGTAGTFTKAQYLTTAVATCAVSSYALGPMAVHLLDPNVAQLTFTATQRATCAGNAEPPKVQVISTYVRRGGQWLWASYADKPAKEKVGLTHSPAVVPGCAGFGVRG